MVAIRGGLGAWRSVGVERLAYQVLGAMTAGWAWLAVLSWQGYTPEEGVGYSSMAFGGLALGLAVASRVIDIKRDTLAVWGGLGAGGVFVAGVIGFGLEEPERIGPWLAIGFGVLALAMELAWRKVDPALRVLTVGVTAFAWPALIIGLGWDLSTSVRVSAVVFGLLTVVVAEVGRLQLRGEVAEPGDLGLPVARTWGGLAAAGVVIAALGYEGNAANGYAIASGLATLSVGLARGAWEHALHYAQERKQFGKTIAEFQGIQFQLAQMATELEAARLMVYNAARMKDAGMNFVKEAAMAKLFASQMAERVTSLAVEIYGGYGFTKDYPVEKYWRDSKIGKIYEGTSNMQLQTIARLVLGNK